MQATYIHVRNRTGLEIIPEAVTCSRAPEMVSTGLHPLRGVGLS